MILGVELVRYYVKSCGRQTFHSHFEIEKSVWPLRVLPFYIELLPLLHWQKLLKQQEQKKPFAFLQQHQERKMIRT